MNIVKLSKARDGETRLSENFKVKEFACSDGTDEILIDLDMIPVLQTIRNVGGRVTINSAYRTPEHNKKIGGASKSFHMQGRAFDIVSENLSVDEICNLAYTLGVKGIIKYPTFVHIDSRDYIYHANDKGSKLKYSRFEDEALKYLVSKGRILDEKHWQERLKENDIMWLIIKWSQDVKLLTKYKK